MGRMFVMISFHKGPMPSFAYAASLYLYENVKFLIACRGNDWRIDGEYDMMGIY